MNFPSKKIIAVLFVCVAIIAGAIYFKASKSQERKGSLSATSKNSAPPLKSKDFYKQSAKIDSSSVTDSMSKDFFVNFVDLQNKGNWNVNSQTALIENLSTNYATSAPILVNIGNMQAFSDLEKEKTRLFGNKTAEIINKYAKDLKTNPFDALNEAINSPIGSSTFHQRLSIISESYYSLSNELASIPSPANLTGTYADTVNAYYAVGFDVNNMRSYWSDPVRGLMGITGYQRDVVILMNLLKNIAIYFKSNGIIFSDTEQGKMWNSLSQ